ncbi:MAG TPA: hypothetical protein DEH78_08425, partial [Solibacterales bacterium]|nr:hypothetical protein [Bryobacterales bacterium]
GETGLDYFGARYFGSAQGRFTSPDPYMPSADVKDPQSWNRYVYARNNPAEKGRDTTPLPGFTYVDKTPAFLPTAFTYVNTFVFNESAFPRAATVVKAAFNGGGAGESASLPTDRRRGGCGRRRCSWCSPPNRTRPGNRRAGAGSRRRTRHAGWRGCRRRCGQSGGRLRRCAWRWRGPGGGRRRWPRRANESGKAGRTKKPDASGARREVLWLQTELGQQVLHGNAGLAASDGRFAFQETAAVLFGDRLIVGGSHGGGASHWIEQQEFQEAHGGGHLMGRHAVEEFVGVLFVGGGHRVAS